jgi:hypothetical protein
MTESYIATSSRVEEAEIEDHKRDKYSFLPTCYTFQLITLKMLGPFNQSDLNFVLKVGRRLQDIS